MIIIIFFENMVIDAFLACLFNVHYLIFLSMVHEYAYLFQSISNYYKTPQKHRETSEIIITNITVQTYGSDAFVGT